MNELVTSNDLELIVFGADDLKCLSRAHQSTCTVSVTHRYINSHGRDIPVCADVSVYVGLESIGGGRCACGRSVLDCWSVLPI